MHSLAVIQSERVSSALVASSRDLNDSIYGLVVPMAGRHGSLTPPQVRFVHYQNMTAKAIGLAKSDAAIVAGLPIEERAILSLIRHGVTERLPQWIEDAELFGGAKPHNRVFQIAKRWVTAEVAALRAVGFEAVIESSMNLIEEGQNHG